MAGGDGNDGVNGGAGNDHVLGNSGDDGVLGGPRTDTVEGNDGVDHLDAVDPPTTADTLIGGADADRCFSDDGDTPPSLTGGDC